MCRQMPCKNITSCGSSCKVINYKHNAKIYTPICLFSFLLVTKCFFLRGSISQYSNELYLCFLAIFSRSLLSILPEHNIKCISYCSLWQFNLLCLILQISSTNDCMPLILLTSLISPSFHHILSLTSRNRSLSQHLNRSNLQGHPTRVQFKTN